MMMRMRMVTLLLTDEKHHIQDRPNGTNAFLTKVKNPASSVTHQSDLSSLHQTYRSRNLTFNQMIQNF